MANSDCNCPRTLTTCWHVHTLYIRDEVLFVMANPCFQSPIRHYVASTEGSETRPRAPACVMSFVFQSDATAQERG